MRPFSYALLLSAALPSVGFAQTGAPAVAAPAYSTATTALGVLRKDPAAQAILEKYLPEMMKSEQIEMASSLTLRSLQGYAPAMLSDERLGRIDAELAKLPARK